MHVGEDQSVPIKATAGRAWDARIKIIPPNAPPHSPFLPLSLLPATQGLTPCLTRASQSPSRPWKSPSPSLPTCLFASGLQLPMPPSWFLRAVLLAWLCSSLSQPHSMDCPPPSLKSLVSQSSSQVYPVGISLADAAIVGVTQRMQKSGARVGLATPLSHANYPLFHPMAESQPVLPCLLRRLLQKGAFDEAVVLARRHARGHYFPRSLEWLLFTSLEIEHDLHRKVWDPPSTDAPPPTRSPPSRPLLFPLPPHSSHPITPHPSCFCLHSWRCPRICPSLHPRAHPCPASARPCVRISPFARLLFSCSDSVLLPMPR